MTDKPATTETPVGAAPATSARAATPDDASVPTDAAATPQAAAAPEVATSGATTSQAATGDRPASTQAQAQTQAELPPPRGARHSEPRDLAVIVAAMAAMTALGAGLATGSVIAALIVLVAGGLLAVVVHRISTRAFRSAQ